MGILTERFDNSFLLYFFLSIRRRKYLEYIQFN